MTEKELIDKLNELRSLSAENEVVENTEQWLFGMVNCLKEF